jgi:aspartate racemase
MGANASSYFLQLLINKINKNNLKMPEIILDSFPIDDFISDISKINRGLISLKSIINKFNLLKIDMAVMCCNTAHILYPQIFKNSKFKFPSLINLVSTEVNKNNCQNIGILASPNTIKYQLYQFNNKKLFIPNIKLQQLLEKSIRQIIKSDFTKVDNQLLVLQINKFIKKNKLDGLILGCTELPIIFSKLEAFNHIKIFNCLDILANSVVNFLSNLNFSLSSKGDAANAERDLKC